MQAPTSPNHHRTTPQRRDEQQGRRDSSPQGSWHQNQAYRSQASINRNLETVDSGQWHLPPPISPLRPLNSTVTLSQPVRSANGQHYTGNNYQQTALSSRNRERSRSPFHDRHMNYSPSINRRRDYNRDNGTLSPPFRGFGHQ